MSTHELKLLEKATEYRNNADKCFTRANTSTSTADFWNTMAHRWMSMARTLESLAGLGIN